jgi:hypothetical protein
VTRLKDGHILQYDAAYILGKAGVALRQLAFGLPGPRNLSRGKTWEEKLLVHFREPTE